MLRNQCSKISIRKIGLGEEVLSQKIVAKNLSSLKVNVRKLVSVKNYKLENWWKIVRCSKKCKLGNWYQKLLNPTFKKHCIKCMVTAKLQADTAEARSLLRVSK